ncbi:aminotransferase class III-fold pyridoxal phosphate-dependent enzyme [Mesorhizobium sp. Cs1299R1N3]|uniref:aminotransferase class III-fold pyridoxal phosphate-dependent enzyme n=1 Tax=Mesorhizobium sp. Cs1299R1N3 TaxID=3015173 RepID=UPI00301E04A7
MTTQDTHENFLRETNARLMWHPMAHAADMQKTPPKIFVRAAGIEIEDIDGKRVLDAVGGLWNVNLGYSSTPVKAAIAEQLEILPYCSTFRGTTDDKAIELSYELTKWFEPDGMARAFFTQGGSDSVDTAMRLIRQYWKLRNEPQRTRFIAFSKGYHGTHYGGASLCGDARFRQAYEPMLEGVFHAPSPYAYRNPFNEDDPAELARRCVAEVRKIAMREGPETIAAIAVEPVAGSGGIIVPHESFMPALRALCDEFGILLVADEVICAFGRTGAWSGSRLWGVQPDVMTIAKALTNGYFPMGAALLGPKIAEVFESDQSAMGTIGHGYTNSGNPVGAAAALATLKETERLDVATNAAERGAELLRGLEELKTRFPIIGDIRGKGLMAAVEMVESRESRAPAAKSTINDIYEATYDAGVLVRMSGNMFILSPSLILESSDIERIVNALDAGFAKYA